MAKTYVNNHGDWWWLVVVMVIMMIVLVRSTMSTNVGKTINHYQDWEWLMVLFFPQPIDQVLWKTRSMLNYQVLFLTHFSGQIMFQPLVRSWVCLACQDLFQEIGSIRKKKNYQDAKPPKSLVESSVFFRLLSPWLLMLVHIVTTFIGQCWSISPCLWVECPSIVTVFRLIHSAWGLWQPPAVHVGKIHVEVSMVQCLVRWCWFGWVWGS